LDFLAKPSNLFLYKLFFDAVAYIDENKRKFNLSNTNNRLHNVVTMLIHFAAQTHNNIHQMHISTESNIQDNEEHRQLSSLSSKTNNS